LSLPVYRDSALSEEVAVLAQDIAGTDASAEKRELARRIAEAQIDLHRVRNVRHQLLSEALNGPDCESEVMLDKFANILADKSRELLALERYERRALSRRKFAIRTFDAACR
jgi:hypothetical protein